MFAKYNRFLFPFHRRIFVKGFFLALVLVIMVTSTALGDLINQKISGYLPYGVYASYPYPQMSPDGKYMVFAATRSGFAEKDLYSVPVFGGARYTLSRITAAGGKIDSFQITANSQRVVYLADQETAGKRELYSAPIDGSSDPVKISGEIIYGGEVIEFQVSPNSQRAVYKADQDRLDCFELYSIHVIPTEGETPVKINEPLDYSLLDVYDFQITPNSAGVIYIADQETDEVNELYANLITGGTPQKLSDNMGANGDVFDFKITPDSGRVVYTADVNVHNRFELYSVQSTGGNPPGHLSQTLFAGDSVESFSIAPAPGPDGKLRVVYSTYEAANGYPELYSVVVLDGSGRMRLNNDFPDGVENTRLSSFQISPNGDWVVYQAEQAIVGIDELYSVAIDRSTIPKRLNLSLPDDDLVYFQIVPNSVGVVYAADENNDGIYGLFSVTMDGNTRFTINADYYAGSRCGFVIAPDSLSLFYLAHPDPDGYYGCSELYYVSIFGGASLLINVPREDGDIVYAWYTPDSKKVVYLSSQEWSGYYNLYITFDGTRAYVPSVIR